MIRYVMFMCVCDNMNGHTEIVLYGKTNVKEIIRVFGERP